MMNDEPIDIALGLPGPLPAGERVLWHGKPERAALLRYLGGLGAKGIEEQCARLYNIPNVSRWCPRTLLQESQTASYYKQLSLEAAHRRGWDNWQPLASLNLQ